jgi:hypothetical protein
VLDYFDGRLPAGHVFNPEVLSGARARA